jgi:hypothetical protein
MESFTSLFKKDHMGQLLLTVLFIIYLIMGYNPPDAIANMVDTMGGKIIVFVLIIYLFLYANPILAVLGLFVGYDLIRRSAMTTGLDALAAYMPTEKKKFSQFTAFNQFPYTLEQEMVKKMAPQTSGVSLGKASYVPLLDNLYDASPITDSN